MAVVKSVKHINFIEVQKEFELKYNFQHRPYWEELIEDHMFRGNDSSKKFYCQVLEEVFPEKLLVHFNFLPDNIKKLLMLYESEDILKQVLKTSGKDFIEAYHQLSNNKDSLIQALGDDAYFYKYLIRSMVECAIISDYKLKDYLNPKEPYFYYFSW